MSRLQGRGRLLLPVSLAAAVTLATPLAAQERIVLDPMDQVAPWEAHPSEGIAVRLATDSAPSGRALRADIDFKGGGGYAVLRRPLPLDLPENYVFEFLLRGTLPPNNLEFKLIDASGGNVWWSVRRDFAMGNEFARVTVRKRQVSFAWGPKGGGDLERVASLELAITAGEGGTGSVWLDELAFTPLPAVDTTWPIRPARTTGARGSAAAADSDSSTSWTLVPNGRGSLTLDLGAPREFGGVVLHWADAGRPVSIVIDGSADGAEWTGIAAVAPGLGRQSHVWTGEQEARYVRIDATAAAKAVALLEVEFLPVTFGSDRNAFMNRVAADALPGLYPRVFGGPTTWWTVVGTDGGAEEALFDEFGRVELGERAFSIEPFLRIGGELLSWKGAITTLGLSAGVMPRPATRLTWPRARLDVDAWAIPAGGGGSLVGIRYVVANPAPDTLNAELLLAMRPLQVNPPAQFLNVLGGVGRAEQVRWDGSTLEVDGRAVRTFPAPFDVGASTFEQGTAADWLAAGRLPPADSIADPLGLGAALLRYPMVVPPGGEREVYLQAALDPGAELVPHAVTLVMSRMVSQAQSAAMLADFHLRGPPEVEELDRVVRSSAGYILVNRDSAAIQPGSRAYARSWIRDAALTSSALLRLGLFRPVREFLEWFAPFQYESGKVPCCVDRYGAGPVPENDSHGEFIYLATEYARRSNDTALLRQLWPGIEAAAQYMDSLRGSHLTDAYQSDSLLPYRGLLPESISHEGYSARPVHSFWDQFFALRGFRDAAAAATMLGLADSAHWRGVADAFELDLLASIDATIRLHGIDFVPGSVELGDFDATSTTIAGDPVHVMHLLPRAALERTFAMLDSILAFRRLGGDWDAYTPYEARNVGAMVRLGWRESALRELRDLMADRRPVEWNQWPEVIFQDARATRFLGDLPHTWVASDVVRSILDLFVHEDADGSLVMLAGVPKEWLEGEGVDIRIPWSDDGEVSFRARARGGVLQLEGLKVPPGRSVIVSPPEGLAQ